MVCFEGNNEGMSLLTVIPFVEIDFRIYTLQSIFQPAKDIADGCCSLFMHNS